MNFWEMGINWCLNFVTYSTFVDVYAVGVLSQFDVIVQNSHTSKGSQALLEVPHRLEFQKYKEDKTTTFLSVGQN